MAIIRNLSIAKDARRILDTKQNDNIGSVIADVIQPIISITRTPNIVSSAFALAANPTFTTFTTPTDKDFYLTDFVFSFAKDAASDITRANVRIRVEEGGIIVVAEFVGFTLVAINNITINHSFNYPIKLNRNSVIDVQTNGTVGLGIASLSIVGFTVETITNSVA